MKFFDRLEVDFRPICDESFEKCIDAILNILIDNGDALREEVVSHSLMRNTLCQLMAPTAFLKYEINALVILSLLHHGSMMDEGYLTCRRYSHFEDEPNPIAHAERPQSIVNQPIFDVIEQFNLLSEDNAADFLTSCNNKFQQRLESYKVAFYHQQDAYDSAWAENKYKEEHSKLLSRFNGFIEERFPEPLTTLT